MTLRTKFRKSFHRRGRRNQKGQASIMIGVMMLTFISFFAFVVNTGMLVHAKINLQNAADLAAYAGAAVQARQLNTISFLNYEMRRQYKKFLFRYYVVGNLAQKSFPRPNGDKGDLWSPDEVGPSYQVPSVCIIFNTSDNFCQVGVLPGLKIPPPNILDEISKTMESQLLKIEEIRQRNCGSISRLNRRLLTLWLFNPSPEAQVALSQTSEDEQMLKLIRGLSQGLGLLPRLTLLSFRVRAQEDYLNHKAERLTPSSAQALRQSGDMDNERSVNAFYSAYNTLGDSIWDNQSIEMSELLPPGKRRNNQTPGANIASFQKIQGSFDSYAIMFYANNGTIDLANSTLPQSTNCEPQLIPITVRNAPLGFTKNPQVLSYYAVRLKARAKVLFSPFGDVEMKAYAAAQPFGSRVGGAFPGNPEDWVRRIKPSAIPSTLASGIFGAIPNLPITAGDTTDAGKGWDRKEVLDSLFTRLASDATLPEIKEGEIQGLTSSDLDRGYHGAMVPNPYEVSSYNFLTDHGGDSFARNIDQDNNGTLWAPLFPSGASNAEDQLADGIKELFKSATNESDAENAKIVESLISALGKYVGRLKTGEGENGEGFNTVRLEDPILVHKGTSAGTPETPKMKDFMADVSKPENFRTSWNSIADGDLRKEGRIGYSVKFISFDSLRKSRSPSNGAQTFNNLPELDSDASTDVPLIRH